MTCLRPYLPTSLPPCFNCLLPPPARPPTRPSSRLRRLSPRCSGKGEGLVVTPFAAGHLLGGAVWRIRTRGGEEVGYAPDVNHR